MIEQGVGEAQSDVSSVSLTIQKLTASNLQISPKGIDQSLFRLSQYALAATDISRLLEKGVEIIGDILPVAYIVVAEIYKENSPFCIRAKFSSTMDFNINLHFDHRKSTTYPFAEVASDYLGNSDRHLYIENRFNHQKELLVEISGRYRPFGFLLVAEEGRHLTRGEIKFLYAAADVFAITIDRIQMQQERKKSEELEKIFLESRIQENSEELADINKQLSQSIEQYKSTEAALLRSQKDLRSLSAQLIEVGEQERKRIAGELHDGISQMLTSIKYRLEGAQVQFDKGSIDCGISTVVNVIPAIQEAIQEVRRISMDLRPSILDDIGILATIEWYCNEYAKIYQGIKVKKTINVEESLIAENLKLVIFRVLQEALHNIAKHSNANVVMIEFLHLGENIIFRVTDNGNGIPQEARERQYPQCDLRGFGLRSMRERVEQTAGIFNISSRTGMGTIIEATWTPMTQSSVCDKALFHRI